MNDERIREMIEDRYDSAREDTIRSMLSEFYNRRMAATVVVVWVMGIAFIIGAIYSAVRFFGATETKGQILYAALFICLFHLLGLLKIFAWQLIHRNSIKREIKRLELRLAELAGSFPKTGEGRSQS